MKRWIRGVLVGVAVLLAVVAGSALALHVAGGARLARGPAVAVRTIAVPTDEASLRRGAHLAQAVTGCTSCHGVDLRGEVMIDDATFGRIVANNLTRGAGGFAASATPEDWVRAIRHGIGRDGRVLAGMPADGYAHLSDTDLGAILAYVAAAPPVDNVLPGRRLVFPGTAIAGFLMYDDLPAVRVSKMTAPSAWPAPDVTADYGRYLLSIATCADCHGKGLEGLAPGTPGPPAGPDLTRSGRLGAWTAEEFLHALRTGVAPGGRVLSPDMPFVTFGRMADDELLAIWAALAEMP